jgi:hypothetical protein
LIDETPLMIFPEKTDAPALEVIVTLWGMAASRSANTILNGAPAGALTATGENAKSFASRETVTGAAVGREVGLGVGFAVGAAVGLAVCEAVGLTVGLAVGPTDADAVAAGVTTGSRLAGEAVGAAVADAGLAVGASEEGAGVPDEAVGIDASPLGGGVAATPLDPLQAATSRPMAISRGSRGWGTAAL